MNPTLKCHACNSEGIKRFLSLGNIPPVNAFLNQEEITSEQSYPLNLAYCPKCLLVQLEIIVPPKKLFTNYLHLSAGSASNINHLKEVAEMLNQRFNIVQKTKILEIGSNDGTLLSFLKKYSSKLLGIDPAQNLIKLSQEKGIETLPLFFNTHSANEILKTRGTFDLIVALNVIPHTPDVVDLMRGVHTLLSTNGTLVMEGAYALETILKGEFDTIYHEHVYSFSLHSLIETFKLAKLRVIDVEKISTQGGSLRVFVQREIEDSDSSDNVRKLLEEENRGGLTNKIIYDEVSTKVSNFRNKLRDIIAQEKELGGKLIGLGAPARGMVILNYCGLDSSDIEFIIDDTPLKQGKFAPGVHIPVKSWDALKDYKNQSFILLSWNYKDYIFERLVKNNFSGKHIVIPFPDLEVKTIG